MYSVYDGEKINESATIADATLSFNKHLCQRNWAKSCKYWKTIKQLTMVVTALNTKIAIIKLL